MTDYETGYDISNPHPMMTLSEDATRAGFGQHAAISAARAESEISMTQPVSAPVSDPWAAASASPAPAQPAQQAAPAAASGMASGFGAAAGGSLLFSQGSAAPSLMNKTHLLGTSRTGIIKGLTDKQDQDYNSKTPKYWSTSKVGGEQRNRAITTDAIDGPTGQPNRPVMVTHVELETEYRLSEGEAAAISRDAASIASDTGKRVEVVGGLDFKAFSEAMVDARARGITIASPKDLEGKRLTVTRAGQVPSKSGTGNPSWVKTYRIDNP